MPSALVVPRVVGVLNAGSALIGVAVAAGDGVPKLSVHRRTVLLGGAAALGWSAAAAQGTLLARFMHRRPTEFAVASLGSSALCHLGFGGWMSPMYLHGVMLAGGGATVIGPRRGEVFGMLASGGYLLGLARTVSVGTLRAEGDLFRIPINAGAFVLAGSIGNLLARSERRLRGLEHDLGADRDRAVGLRRAVSHVVEADRLLERLLHDEVLGSREQVSTETAQTARAAAEALVSYGGLAEVGEDGKSDLRGALERLMGWEQRFLGEGTSLRLAFDSTVPARTDPRVVDAFSRVALRALQNVRQHAPATTRVAMHVGGGGAGLEFEVSDDGGGLEDRPVDLLHGGGGLADARRELDNLGGALFVESAPPHFSVRATVPAGTVPARRPPKEQRGDPVAALDRDVGRAAMVAAVFAAGDALSIVLADPWYPSAHRVRGTAVLAVVTGGSALAMVIGGKRPRAFLHAGLALAGIVATPVYRTPYGIWAGVAGTEVGWTLGWGAAAAYGAAAATAVGATGAASAPIRATRPRKDVPISLAVIPGVIGAAGALARSLRLTINERAHERGTLVEQVTVLWRAGDSYRTRHDFVQNFLPLLERHLDEDTNRKARTAYDRRAQAMHELDQAIEERYGLEPEVTAAVAARVAPTPVDLVADADGALPEPRSERAVVLNLERRVRLTHLVGAATDAMLEAHPPGLFGRPRMRRLRVRIRMAGTLARVDLTPDLRGGLRTPALTRLRRVLADVGGAQSRTARDGRIYVEIDLGGLT